VKILYQIPGDMTAGPLGPAELTRRQRILQDWAFSATVVEVADTPGGPPSIESYAEELLCVGPMLRTLTARPARPDAVIIGCFGDPGLGAVREVLDCLVVGPFEASFHVASQLGRRVGVVTVLDNVVPVLDHLVRGMGETLNWAGAVSVNISVLDLKAHADALASRVAEVARPLVDDRGADVLLVGCMSMAFLGVAEELGLRLGVPVVNPARAALKTAEMLVALGVGHSRRTYPRPPKPIVF
jgi:allantoin racemase